MSNFYVLACLLLLFVLTCLFAVPRPHPHPHIIYMNYMHVPHACLLVFVFVFFCVFVFLCFLCVFSWFCGGFSLSLSRAHSLFLPYSLAVRFKICVCMPIRKKVRQAPMIAVLSLVVIRASIAGRMQSFQIIKVQTCTKHTYRSLKKGYRVIQGFGYIYISIESRARSRDKQFFGFPLSFTSYLTQRTCVYACLGI